jgi:adenylate kinase family enzyme
MVIGPSGAGKSTLARRMGERLDLPVVHLDRLFWNPGWVPTETAGFRARMVQAVAGERWVIDGNYSAHMDLRLPRAEAVIWLDLPRRVYFPRTVWRMIRNWGRTRSDIGPGCPERFDLAFFRDWVWTYPTRSRARQAKLMAELDASVMGIILRSPAEVRQFAIDLPRSVAGSARD